MLWQMRLEDSRYLESIEGRHPFETDKLRIALPASLLLLETSFGR